MLRRNEIQESMEAHEVRAAGVEPTDALKIEEVLRRAREIHRNHGGMFGYDFEDWAQAWSAEPEDSRRRERGLVNGVSAELMIANARKALEPCLGCGNN